jgi:hypothetical protein
MDAVIPWKRLLALIEPHYPKAGNGTQPKPMELMLRIYFMQIAAPPSTKNEQKARCRSSARARGEHAFHVVKRLWGFSKVRYRGLAKNTARLYTAFALAPGSLGQSR